MIFHAALSADWEQAQRTGVYTTSTRGRALDEEGFIHAAYAWQVDGVANRFYAEVDTLVLLTVDVGRLSVPVRDEAPPDATGDEVFPHVYGPIPLDAIVEVRPWRRGTDGHWRSADAQPGLAGTAELRRTWHGRLRALPGAEMLSYILGFAGLTTFLYGTGVVGSLALQWYWYLLAVVWIAFSVAVRVAAWQDWARRDGRGVHWRSLWLTRSVPWGEIDALVEGYWPLGTLAPQALVIVRRDGRRQLIRPSLWCGTAARQEFLRGLSDRFPGRITNPDQTGRV